MAFRRGIGWLQERLPEPVKKIQRTISAFTHRYRPEKIQQDDYTRAESIISDADTLEALHNTQTRKNILKIKDSLIFKKYLSKISDLIELTLAREDFPKAELFSKSHLEEINKQKDEIKDDAENEFDSSSIYFYKVFHTKKTEIIEQKGLDPVNKSAATAEIQSTLEIEDCVPNGTVVRVVKSYFLEGKILDGDDEHVEHYNVFVIYPT